MPPKRCLNILRRPISLHFQALYIQRIDREDVVMNDRIVPWRTRPVIAVVITLHIRIARKPSRITINPMLPPGRSIRPRLAMSLHAIALVSRRDRFRGSRDVPQQPMIKIHPRQRRRHFAPFLIHIITLARDIRVVNDHRKRPRAFGRVFPGQMRIPIAAQRYVVRRIRHRKRKLARNGAAFLKLPLVNFMLLSPLVLLDAFCNANASHSEYLSLTSL
jgi:hypothetical protein